MKRKIIAICILLVLICAGLVLSISMSPTKEMSIDIAQPSKKPVIIVTVDSLMTEPLKKAIQDGKAPAFSFLVNKGQLYPDFISSYPTMSVTIDSTLLTGTYANEHKIPGLIWFKEEENRMISYGSGISEMWHNGLKNVALDSVIRYNQQHLSKEVQTIHEALANQQLQSASINGLLFRGNVQHQMNVPKLISLVNLLPGNLEMNGPTLLSLGALSQYNPKNDRHKLAWDRLGFNNDFTINELKFLIQNNQLPSFTLAYLPDADAELHKNGPNDLKAIEKADASLQQLFDTYSSWEEAIEEATWIVLGDSGQSFIGKNKESSLINLNDILNNYSFWERKNKDAQMAIAINERMAYIYINDGTIPQAEVIDTLKKEERIHFIAWTEDGTNYVASPQSEQLLTFSPNGPYIDPYKQTWTIEGDVTILDVTLAEQNTIQYNHYPDALARLHGALHSQEGNVLIVDAKPYFEFITEHSHDHAGGGAHGSLHKMDSVVPVIVAGTDEKPPFNRLVDLKEWILQLVGGS
ncbi:alkaline phosphatase family protein [Lysinibacillus sp. KU-BSD001]|uniref:alkaline phosphatase family protein n=1 Tax=Lysinibacillus sp. KU-BSD001 TaxID=3141328 RepID=UPI0036E9103D